MIVPRALLAEAALVPGLRVRAAERLSDVVAWLRDEQHPLPAPGAPAATAPDPQEPADLADVRGQPDGVRALEVAAAGGHHLLLVGRPGSGATMLARRLPGLLPNLSGPQALEVTAIGSLAGTLTPEAPLITRPPFVAPHHSMSVPALVGGGVGMAKPGAISQAHNGVLFLDQAAEFGHKLESLRTALEDGEIRLARRDGVARYPARFQLVLASPPCPCGPFDAGCSCSPHAQRRYLARLSGPLLDRVDLRVRLRPAPPANTPEAAAPDSTSVVRQRVQHARQRAAHRWAEYGVRTNAEVPGTVLWRAVPLPDPVLAPVDRALAVGSLTRRGAERVLRVSWTLSDLAGLDRPGADQIAEALAFRDRRPA